MRSLVRSLVALLLLGVASSASIAASSTDFVSAYYRLYWREVKHQAVLPNITGSTTGSAGDIAMPVSFKQDVPKEVEATLEPFGLDFASLPGLLQRALLWDAGYAIGDNETLAHIYTRCEGKDESGVSMVDLALQMEEMDTAGCKVRQCSTGKVATWSYSTICGPDDLDYIARCACTSVKTTADDTAVWATGGPNTMDSQEIDVVIRRHSWSDRSTKKSSHVYALHTRGAPAVKGDGSVGGECSTQATQSALTIPCLRYLASDSRWCRPTSTALMSKWLKEYVSTFLDDQELSPAAKAAEGAKETARYRASGGIIDASSTNNLKDGEGVIVGVDSGFQYDGKSSDLAQQFYRRHVAGDDVEPLSVETSRLPKAVQDRVLAANLTFAGLPALLQRALLWDTGFAFGDSLDGALTGVYTRCGLSMAEIAVTKEDFEAAGCEPHNCSSNGGASTSRSLHCTGDQIASVSMCATSGVDTPVHVAMWADGGDSSAVPDVNVMRHAWEDQGQSYLVYALHTIRGETPYAQCPRDQVSSGMIIPCVPYIASSTNASTWCRPEPGKLVSSWIAQVASAQGNTQDKQGGESDTAHWSRITPVLVVGGIALLATCIAVFIYMRRRARQRVADKQNVFNTPPLPQHTLGGMAMHQTKVRRSELCDSSLLAGGDVFGSASSMDGLPTTLSTSPTNWIASPLARSPALSSESFASARTSSSRSSMLNVLANDPLLQGAQIPFEELQFHHLIALGAHGEVWLCVLHRRRVAVKRMLKAERSNLVDLESFVSEIRLNAPLRHPNIVAFVGVTWSSVQNLCLVTEYLEMGDLHHYLRQAMPSDCNAEWEPVDLSRMSLSWRREKMQIALGIARGLNYLHQQRIIHRHLKAKNVLLTTNLDAKLMDFGVSRRETKAISAIESTQTVATGVGTPYWTAPEVLAGGDYSEKADIYSLGVVLSELDVHESPYFDAVTARGQRLPPFQILQRVLAGQIQPSLSQDCPPEVVALIRACLEREPSARPSAGDAAQRLGGMPGANFDIFSF